MMDFFKQVSVGFWTPKVWLPPNVSWSDLEPNDKIAYTDHRHLIIPLGMALLFLVLRYFLENYWFSPVGLYLGIRTRSHRGSPNVVLEKAYRTREKLWLDHEHIVGLAKQLDWTERQVERWLRVRRAQDKPSTLVKFCESCWRWLYYTFSFCYGIMCLWDKPWLWDINHCYYGYPHQGITTDCWWYYMFSLSFYWSLTFSQFFDVKRKDFWQMFVHHIATVSLLSFSWICNLHRIGTIVLLVHDCADTFLEAAKCAKYAQYQKTCDVIFAVFTVIWIVTRCGIYPFWVIYSTSITAPQLVPMFPAYYFFNGLLVLLLVLHLFWTYIILKIVHNSIYAGQMDGDIRSSSSEELTDHDANHTNVSKKKPL